jgi:hypothetical protein
MPAAFLVLALGLPGSAMAASNPVLAGSVNDSNTLSGVTSVAVIGHHAYSTAYYPGELAAVDISNPASPTIAGASASSPALLNASTVNIVGGYAYVVSKNRNGTKGSNSNDDGSGNSLTILDVTTNPAQPAIVGSVTDATNLFGGYGVAVAGHYAYVAAQGCLSGQPCPNPNAGNSFAVVDISSPSAPSVVATLHNNSLPAPWAGSGALAHACAVAISGNYAYLTAAYSNRLTVIDISNPLSPTIVASLQDGTNLNFPVDVAVRGGYAFVADQISTGRLTVVDVRDPTSPQVAGSLASTWLNGAYRVRLRGNFAYVSAASAGAVSAVDISTPPNPRFAAGFYDAARLNKTTGLDVDSTGRYVIASSPYLSSQAQPTYPPFALQTGGPTLTGTVSAITLDPAPISVSITASSKPANPTTQTSANFQFSANDSVASVQCQLDGGPFAPCTGATNQQYASLGGGSHTFNVQATDSAGATATASYTWIVNAPPADASPPTISGSAVLGQVLTAATGTWSGSPSFSYQWLRCDGSGANCLPISGATASSYTTVPGDVGATLVVAVTGSNSAGSALASSAPTGVVTAPSSAPVNTGLPVVSGSTVQGKQLSASNGSWTGSPAPSFSYLWLRCDGSGANCLPISGATASSYTTVPGDVGSTLVVTVTASNSAGSPSATSAPTAVVTATASAPTNTSVPAISGSAVEAQTLTTSTGAWSGSPAPSFSYQFQRCNTSGASCTAIAGATASSYVLVAADVGSTVRALVTGTNPSGSAQASSAASAVISSAPGPVTSLLDNFNQANNSGPPGTNWTHMIVSSTTSSNNLLISGQQITGTSGSNADYWNSQAFGPDSEVWITVATKPNVDLDPVVLGLRFQNPDLATASGYQAYHIFRSSGPDQWKIISRTNGTTSTTLASVSGPTLQPGDQILFRAIGSTLELWRFSGGTWTRILTATDSTYKSSGYINLSSRNGVVRLDNFGGGTLP